MLVALGGNASAPAARGRAPEGGLPDALSVLFFIGAILLFIALRFYFFRGSSIWMMPGGGSWRAGPGGSSGGFGGGFSGGGGSFGGGGASGKW